VHALLDWSALWLSVKLSAVVTAILIAIGLPVAYWITFSRWRWKFLAEAVVALPIVLPPTVLGFYVLIAVGSQSPLGQLWMSWTGHTLAFTFEGLVLASILYSLPFAVQPMAAGFAQVDRSLIEAASTLGASRQRTFTTVILPLALDGVLAGAVLAFAHTLGEFGVVLMVGGNLPGVTRTVSIAIYDNVQSLNYEAANLTALLLLVFSFTVLAFVYGIRRQPPSAV